MFVNRCKRIRKRLKPYADKELDQSGNREIARHLERCGDCRRSLDTLNGVAARLGSLGEIDPPAGFAAAVVFRARSLRQADSVMRDAPRPARFWMLTPVGRAAVMLFFVGIFTGRFMSGWLEGGTSSFSEGDQEFSVAYLDTFEATQPSALEEGYWSIAAPEEVGP